MSYKTHHQRLEYLTELLHKNAPLSPASIAEKFECCRRTARRMIGDLREDRLDIVWCRSTQSYIINDSPETDRGG